MKLVSGLILGKGHGRSGLDSHPKSRDQKEGGQSALVTLEEIEAAYGRA